MASIPPFRVRDVTLPEGAVPPGVWADVVKRVGGLILARTETETVDGQIKLHLVTHDEAIGVVKKILLEHDCEPWGNVSDWWKTE